MRLCTASEMMAVDGYAIQQLGIPGVVLMENAGRGCCAKFVEKFGASSGSSVVVLTGKGNNGGDGYVMARVLAEQGWQVITLVLAEKEAIKGDARVMLDILQQLNLPVEFLTDISHLSNRFSVISPDIVIDAIFGTGLKSNVRGLQAEAIKLINQSPATVFSVDIPSGVDGSTGRVCGLAVQADLTVTFDHAKIGHGCQPGSVYAGDLGIVDIGIPQKGRPAFSTQVQLVDFSAASRIVPDRSSTGHKGRFGHLLVVAGSSGKTGAAALAGNGAVRSGCGLVTVATPATVHDIIEVKLTEAMSVPLSDHEGLLLGAAAGQVEELLQNRDALAFGPGLGQSDELIELIQALIPALSCPVVIDADGLNLLANDLGVLNQRNNVPVVLTPHPGEMARLTGLTVADIEANRFEIAQKFAREHGVVLLLKGARTVIAAPDGRVNINSTGNDGLASGGSGDVLTGLIGGLLAQGMDGFSAATLGAWLHGRAAELVAALQGTAGMAASDLLTQLPVARDELVKGACTC